MTDRGRRQARDDAVAYRVEVVDQIPFGGVGPVEQGLVEVGQRYPVPLLGTAHAAILAHRGAGGLASCRASAEDGRPSGMAKH